MNKKYLKDLRGRHLKVIPPVKGSSADTWFADIDADGRLKLSASTGFSFHVSPDNMHSYQSDPTNPQGGFILLRGRLSIDGYNLRYSPFIQRPLQPARRPRRNRSARRP